MEGTMTIVNGMRVLVVGDNKVGYPGGSTQLRDEADIVVSVDNEGRPRIVKSRHGFVVDR